MEARFHSINLTVLLNTIIIIKQYTYFITLYLHNRSTLKFYTLSKATFLDEALVDLILVIVGFAIYRFCLVIGLYYELL